MEIFRRLETQSQFFLYICVFSVILLHFKNKLKKSCQKQAAWVPEKNLKTKKFCKITAFLVNLLYFSVI